MSYTGLGDELVASSGSLVPVREETVARPRKYKTPVNQSVTFNAAELHTIRAEAKRQALPVSALIRRILLQSLGISEELLETSAKGDSE
jgi:hypothetical protein